MKDGAVSAETRVSVLLAEYRAMYDLALFRLNSLDRRVPLTGSALTASLAAALVLPIEAQLFILIAVPLALVWFLRTTINHAQSFEDALRRIEQIEIKLNELAGDELVRFQSRHPSRGKATGGRTGRETIAAVLIANALVLMGCTWLTLRILVEPPTGVLLLCYFGFIALYLLAVTLRLGRYRYGPFLTT
ncbi:MAG: hypothetical protein AAGI37_20885 [Planctomycetota bacterium]